jgi:predicted nucleic acid-binding protein
MKFVADANVLFSAATRDSKAAELLLRDDLSLYAPEYLFDEFEKYRKHFSKRHTAQTRTSRDTSVSCGNV